MPSRQFLQERRGIPKINYELSITNEKINKNQKTLSFRQSLQERRGISSK